MTHLAWEKLSNRYTYTEFRQLADQLLAKGQTTGQDHSDAMIHYTELNVTRMKRLDKRSRLTEETLAALQKIERPLVWLTLTEAWCGDAAQVIPVLEQMAASQSHIDHFLILRDEHLDIMDAFLTGGARAIPITIVIDKESNEVLGHWGPRPEVLQYQMMEVKAASLAATSQEERTILTDQAKIDAQKWYARDKTLSTQKEVLEMLETLLKH
ncbi:thioredoxin family protein [Lewinella cohaerens]|uniref:thioredoxin family protein n=1 Tax=Lewinella cohaerens TaxID=70995 RepID=UPI000365BFAC|nr:thioredoxin family protein [Lewinella cohaerens]